MTLNLQEMSRQEKLKVMHQLWEDLARDEEHIESPAWHADALREGEHEEELRQSAELYAEVYEQDTDLQRPTESANDSWPA